MSYHSHSWSKTHKKIPTEVAEKVKPFLRLGYNLLLVLLDFCFLVLSFSVWWDKREPRPLWDFQRALCGKKTGKRAQYYPEAQDNIISIQESNTEVLEIEFGYFLLFYFFALKKYNKSPQRGLFMKNRTPWPASVVIVGAPFQIQVVFPNILENSERLCNVECFQTSNQKPENSSRALKCFQISKVFLFKILKFLVYLPRTPQSTVVSTGNFYFIVDPLFMS